LLSILKTIADRIATDDDMRDVLENLADDPTYQELLEMIRNLNEDEQ